MGRYSVALAGTASPMPISGFERTNVDLMSIISSRLWGRRRWRVEKGVVKRQAACAEVRAGKSAVAGAVGTTPLQAADFAAYEILKAHRLGENLPLYRYRRSILELAKIPA
jgi:hypothetical protein